MVSYNGRRFARNLHVRGVMSDRFANDVEFNKLCAGEPAQLVGVMLEIAADEYPHLEREPVDRALARLGAAARRRLRMAGDDLSLHDKLVEISRLLFVEEGFHGNHEAYYDPRNSYLHEVLERRVGIPISLSIVYLAVAAAAGVEVRGVPTPGHFLLSAVGDAEVWFIDPFGDGEVLDLDGARGRLIELFGTHGAVSDEAFCSASNFEIVVRVLRNLKAAYAMDDRWAETLPVQERLVAMMPERQEERRDLGLILLRTGRPHQALEWLCPYVEQCDADNARMMQPYLKTARKMAAEMN